MRSRSDPSAAARSRPLVVMALSVQAGHRFGVVPLDATSARRVYDRIGRLQDTQRFYEDPAVRRLLELGGFDRATSVFELGCGTGRLATYLGVDVSPRMVGIAASRVAPWRPRARVELVEPPAIALPGADRGFDRFVSTYVFDLLSTDDAGALLNEAWRLLAPGGLLGIVSLTHGTTGLSRVVCGGWSAIAKRWPSVVGGCRPIELRDLLATGRWDEVRSEVAVRFGVASEVVIARRSEGASRSAPPSPPRQ
jgi:SAM-dependent methyltransferase